MKITAWALKPKDEDRIGVMFGNYGQYCIWPSYEAAAARKNSNRNDDMEIIKVEIEW